MKPKILFVYDHQYPELWKDGLWAALELLKEDFEITKHNLNGDFTVRLRDYYDFILGWGAFKSKVDNCLRLELYNRYKKGLCIAGNAIPPTGAANYDVLFYETEWYKPQISSHPNIVHAFGVNTDIYKPLDLPKLYDYLSVGSFSAWKRQTKLLDKTGNRLVIGEIQRQNFQESFGIILPLIKHGVAISDMVPPEDLNLLYNLSQAVYIPADIYGGGERAVLEARVCGIPVEIESDNPKLKELLTSPIYDHHYYATQLKKGLLSVL